MKEQEIQQQQKATAENLYQVAREIPPGVALEAARQAESDEERNFYAFISDMNLQREQKKVIEKNLF